MKRHTMDRRTQEWLDQGMSGSAQATMILAMAAAMLFVSAVCVRFSLI